MIERRSNIDFENWPALAGAIGQLIETGAYKALVSVHSRGEHRMHGFMSGRQGYLRFLPWHRAYLVVLERALREIDSSLSLPYWDWNNDAGALVGFHQMIGLAEGREPGASPDETSPDKEPWFASQEQFERFVSHDGTYYEFSKLLEDGPHNAGHRWIGGDMNSMKSPNDPAFWFHHAQVDRIWSLWQENNPAKGADVDGVEAILDPWTQEFTIDFVNDTAQLGNDSYVYV